MTQLSLSEVEQALLSFRVGRRIVLDKVLEEVARSDEIAQPFVLLSRLFARLKSADSILEKIKRKGIVIRSVLDLPEKVPDVLGFRVILETQKELRAIDSIFRGTFDVINCNDHSMTPDEFGGRGIEYALQYAADGVQYPFEVQTRTFLGHYWAARSFHLFHKKSRDVALAHKETLAKLSCALHQAESTAEELERDSVRAATNGGIAAWGAQPLRECVHLVVVEPGEQFRKHEIVRLSGDDQADHETIIARKLALYADYVNAAIVEATCLNFSSFLLNEPHVRVPIERLDALQL
jgi:ppGpp synthetase/RelA/SpoT-type nucleotidyltranferase